MEYCFSFDLLFRLNLCNISACTCDLKTILVQKIKYMLQIVRRDTIVDVHSAVYSVVSTSYNCPLFSIVTFFDGLPDDEP